MKRAWLIIVVAACGQPAAQPVGPGPTPETPVATDCAVSFAVELVDQGAFNDVVVRATNRTGQALDLELPNPCSGPMAFTGLGDQYDYYGTCMAGMCAESSPTAVHLEAGATAVVASASIAPRGATCQPALAAGTYTITPIAPALPVSSCVTGATLEVAAVADAGECTSDGDCVIHCPAAKGCCSSSPCGCSQAVPRSQVAASDADYAGSCDRAPHCDAVDCRLDEAMGARCDQGRCVAMDGPGF